MAQPAHLALRRAIGEADPQRAHTPRDRADPRAGCRDLICAKLNEIDEVPTLNHMSTITNGTYTAAQIRDHERTMVQIMHAHPPTLPMVDMLRERQARPLLRLPAAAAASQ